MRISYTLNEDEIKTAVAEYIRNHTANFVYSADVFLHAERDDRSGCLIYSCTAKSSVKEE
jgi:hypothetical protein